MSRAAVYSLLSTDSALQSLGLQRVYAFQAVDTPVESPFIVTRWDEMQPGVVASRGPHNVTFWVYDAPADYARIDAIIARVKDILIGATHVTGADGYVLTQARWTSDSQDLYDDVYDCVLRTSSFEVIARPA